MNIQFVYRTIKEMNMKKLLLTLIFLTITISAHAQCNAEVKDVLIDEARGTIIVETEYVLNGENKGIGRGRYSEISPVTGVAWANMSEFTSYVRKNVERHCRTLIRRIPINHQFIVDSKTDTQKVLTETLSDNLKALMIGQTLSETETSTTYKGKEITVTYDSQNTITDIP